MIRHVERLFGCELRYAEYILSLQAVLWGLWVGFPWSRPAEIVLGGVAVVFGGALFSALRGERRQLRRWCCFALFVMWLLVAIEMLRSRPGSSDFPAYFGYSALCLFAYLRLSGANI